MMDHGEITQTVAFIRKKIDNEPVIGLILGSGLGVLAEEIDDRVVIPYDVIPTFPTSTVVGHAGQLVFGTLEGKQVVAMQGRFHYYEGYHLSEVTFPIHVMKELGVKQLIVTNAAGGVNECYQPGNLMIILDHINNMNQNPLIGPNDEKIGVRFPDLSNAYAKRLRELAKKVASRLTIDIKEGVYVGNTGPCYETPAEVRMIRQLGGDAVGMSTVPEVIVARHLNLEVLGISCISNMAAGILSQPLNHDEVIETTERVKSDFLTLVKTIIKEL